MPSLFKYATVALATMAPLASAQTYSKCNPMEKSCPPNEGLAESSHDFDFTSSGLDKWTTTAGKVPTGSSNGAEFTINQKGDAPTIQSDFYIHYGTVEVTMKAAPGTGIVSSIVLESDDLDEIDWETIGGNNGAIETNYFGKGDTTTYDRETWVNVDNVQGQFHTYKVDWQKDQTTWSVDGNVVRTLKYDEAKGGSRYPQTPMNIRIGIWAGGDSSNGQGTIDWAGGATDYSAAPFSMYIKDVKVTNQNPAKSYTWTDKSGSSDSIKASGAVSGSHTRDSTTTSSSSSSESTSDAATTTASDASTTATTLTTATQSSSAGKTTPGSTTASSDAASSSAAGSSGAGSSSGGASSTSGSGSSSGSGSDSGSGSSSGSSSESPSASGSATGSATTPTSTFNAAANVAVSYMGPLSLLALVTAFIQL